MRRRLLGISAAAMAHSAVLAAGGAVLRGDRIPEGRPRAPRRAANSNDAPRRRLEDQEIDDDEADNEADNEAADDFYNFDDGATAVDDVYGEDEQGDSQQNNGDYSDTVEAVVNKVHDWEYQAESTAWEFYQTPPQYWTTSQWNLVFILTLSIFGTCCLCAVCCAYQCVKDDDDIDELAPLSPKRRRNRFPWPPRSPRSPESPVSRTITTRKGSFSSRDTKKTRGSSHRSKFTEDHYRRYREDEDEADDEKVYDLGNDTDTVDTEMDDGRTQGQATVPSTHASTKASTRASTRASSASAAASSLDDYTSALQSSSAYEPPATKKKNTTSLADYTSAQRQKEARIFEEWKAKRNDGNGKDYEEWKEEYGASKEKKFDKKALKSTKELDAALAWQRMYGGDKLLEARELQHNLVGYYLE